LFQLDFRASGFNNAPMARVVLENLTKIFAGPNGETLRAVNRANLAVEDQELLVLVGPSGCGKTTTLRLIAGLEEITEGAVWLDGQMVNAVPPKDRDLAMVFQNHALYPHMTAYENMAFGLKLRRIPKDEIARRVRETADLLGIADCLERQPRELSGGQRQRVAVGRAMVRRPKVFLFDEPLSDLDAPLRAQLRTEIVKLHRRLAATMIYVTHDQVEAMTLGNRIAVMKDGVIQQVGDAMNIYHHPANMFVAGFIGSPPMNFFGGAIAQKDGGLFFVETGADGAAVADGLAARLPDNLAARMNDCVGRQIRFGLRPENITDQSNIPEATPGQTIEATVEIVEPRGAETYLHLSRGAQSFVARVHAAGSVRAGQKVPLVFEMGRAHFFDPASGQAIL
jgi:multiple sugar transport system ATP-binding protein